MARQKRKDPLVWGLILIAIGLVFLLENWDFDIWDAVARLWPVILIVWGCWKLYYGLKEKTEKDAASKPGAERP
jgi:putative Mn2+ efflux pump MntP